MKRTKYVFKHKVEPFPYGGQPRETVTIVSEAQDLGELNDVYRRFLLATGFAIDGEIEVVPEDDPFTYTGDLVDDTFTEVIPPAVRCDGCEDCDPTFAEPCKCGRCAEERIVDGQED